MCSSPFAVAACGDTTPDEETVAVDQTQSSDTAESSATGEEEDEAAATDDTSRDGNPSVGDTYTWPDGLAVTISQPVEYTPSESAAGTVDGQANLRFEVTVVNGTSEDVEASMILLTVSSGGRQADEVIDSDWEFPTATILPGNDLTWNVTYSVADPDDLQVTVDNVIDFESEKVHFTN